MLGHVIAIEPRFIGGGDEFQPLVELRCERAVVAVDVVEQSDFHELMSPSC